MTHAVIVVVQKGDHSLGYYDFETGDELGRTALEPYPHEFAISPDGRFAFTCHFGVALAEDEGAGGNTVSVVDLAERRRIGAVDCGNRRRPHGIAFDDVGRLHVLSEGTSSLLVIDPDERRVLRALPTGGEGSHIVSVTSEGRVAFSSNMRSNTVTALFPYEPERPPLPIPVGMRPEGSVLDREERRLFVVNRESAEISVIDVRELRVVDRIATGPGPVRICRDDRDGLIVPLYHARALLHLDGRGRVLGAADLPGAPVSVGFDPVTLTAMASTLEDEIVLVDLDEMRLRRRIPTRSGPDPMSVLRLD
jgi:YVTN family beta-propeller protein